MEFQAPEKLLGTEEKLPGAETLTRTQTAQTLGLHRRRTTDRLLVKGQLHRNRRTRRIAVAEVMLVKAERAGAEYQRMRQRLIQRLVT